MEWDKQRAMACCDECGNIYSVRIQDDNTVHVIGSGGTCPCGSTEFTIIDAEDVGEPAT